MVHITPEQFVDLAEGTVAESSLPHLAACDDCRRELAGLRAMMSDAAAPGNNTVGEVPEPSPLFWNHLSSRVRDAVAEDKAGDASWHAWLLRPRVLVPSLTAVLAALAIVMLLPRETLAPLIPASPLPVASVTVPSLPPLAPLGAPDDPQLGIVAAVATTVEWDEMMDEVAISSAGSTDAVAAALTPDEQRELQRLLAAEVAQPNPLEKRS